LFCLRWFCKWLRPLLQGILAHCSRSNFIFSSWFLTLEKQSQGICPIVIGEMTYYLIACTMVNQFRILSQNILILISLVQWLMAKVR
jgi:hypothetical protein